MRGFNPYSAGRQVGSSIGFLQAELAELVSIHIQLEGK